MKKQTILPILIAGGRGTRFWPLSRKNKPKPLLCLGYDQPMICRACGLLQPLCSPKNMFIATSRELAQEIKKVVPDVPEENFILEPEPRDTAPAIGLSLALISRQIRGKTPEPVLAFIPSDQHLENPGEFAKILKLASRLANEKDMIITIGVKPEFPATVYGYIEPGKKIPGFKNAFFVKRFKEKPTKTRAREYLKRGFFWNAGIFIARPAVLWNAFERHLPDYFYSLQKILDAGARELNSVIKREFSGLKKISFDYAVMEKAENIAVVSGNFGWSDIGGYHSLQRLFQNKRLKNLGVGKLVHRKSDGILVHSDKLVALVGVKNLAIIETRDALLVMDFSQEKELKELVRELEKIGLEQYL